MKKFDILMIGNFAKDKLIVDGVEEIASGGGVYYGSVVARRLGLEVGVITRLHPADYPRLEELRAEGIEVYAIPAEGTSGIANYYQSEDMERRITKPIGFGGQYQLEQLPDWQAKVIMLTPLYAGEVDLDFLKALASRSPVAMDIQGFLRVPRVEDLIFEPWDQLAEGLQYVHALKVDRAEAEFVTGRTDVKAAARKLARFGPKEIVLTQSSGVTVLSDGQFYEAPFTPRSLIGRTGRGDTCFSAYIAMRQSSSAEVACQWAGVITSLKQKKPGPWKGTRSEVENILSATA
jgi:sugar/nucleoside kinase (ribokinase family)